MLKVTFPDHTIKEFKKGITGYEIANSISNRLAREIIACDINGVLSELHIPITEDANIVFYKWEDEKGKSAFWHSSAHLLAQAIIDFYPNAKLTIGPSIENGFYYDVDFEGESLSDKDFERLEKRILENASKDSSFQKRHVSKTEALEVYKDNVYKTELIQNLKDGDITFCSHDNFTDLCRGGHIPSTGIVKSVKILNIAGAYWRGNEKNKQLTRVYGISFPKKKMLDEYLVMLEEAKKRDHRKIGKELELFAFSENVGKGLPLWLPRGTQLRSKLEDFLKKIQIKFDYEQVITPNIGGKKLYVTSGHYDKYGKDSFQPITTPEEGEEFLLKPMNCPHHCEIYKVIPRSYKDLPLRLAEFGTVYRYEQSGELHGLTRVRGFTQDDAHIFCTPSQLKEEFLKVIDIVFIIFKSLNFQFEAQISLRDPNNKEKYIGSDDNWIKAEQAIIDACQIKGLSATQILGEAAFYGPKLDFMVKDALGRKWQLGTIQVDYNLPERFQLEYTGSDNNKHRPVMIHRAPFGSMERFVAVLIEHTGGKFPLWLAPDQAVILPISEKFNDYASDVYKYLKSQGINTYVDDRNEKIGRKIRDGELKKIPYLLIVGEKELQSKEVSVRKHGEGDKGSIEFTTFAKELHHEINQMMNSWDDEYKNID